MKSIYLDFSIKLSTLLGRKIAKNLEWRQCSRENFDKSLLTPWLCIAMMLYKGHDIIKVYSPDWPKHSILQCPACELKVSNNWSKYVPGCRAPLPMLLHTSGWRKLTRIVLEPGVHWTSSPPSWDYRFLLTKTFSIAPGPLFEEIKLTINSFGDCSALPFSL